VLSLPGAMLGHNVDPAVRAAWLEDMFLPPDVLEWALNVVVVSSGGRTILIDAGMGVEFPDLPRAGRLVQRLEAAGIDLASVTGSGPWIRPLHHAPNAIRSCAEKALSGSSCVPIRQTNTRSSCWRARY